MATVKSDEVNYSQASVIHPQYQYQKQYANEGNGPFPISNTQGAVTTFQLTPGVYNLSKSKLCFTGALPAQGANNYAWQSVSGLKSINRITVQIQGGQFLCDATDIDRYLDITARRSYAFDDVQTWDPAITYANGIGTSFFEGLIPSNFAAAQDVRLDNSALIKPGQESEYCISGGSNTATLLDFKIGFDKFTDTFLAVNHDLYWRANITITIYWNTLSKYTWVGTSGTNPTIGAAALAVTNGAAINNPYINVALEANEILKAAVMEKCTSREGLEIKIPYIYGNQVQFPAAGGNNFQSMFVPGQGPIIQKIWWGVYPTTPATPNLVYDKNNLASAKITQFQTQVNGTPVQQMPQIPVNGDDYLLQRDRLRGSDILSFNEHMYNWSYCEDFTYSNKKFLRELFPGVPDENLVDGLPLMGKNLQHNVISTSAIALTNFIFAVFQRSLRISGELIVLE